MDILALDFGARTGYAQRLEDGTLDYGKKEFRAAALGERLHEFREWVTGQVIGRDLVIFERPIVYSRRISGVAPLFGMYAHTITAAHARGVSVREVAPSSLKKAVTGSGKASKAKMCEAVERHYGVKLSPKSQHDQADALGLLWIAEKSCT